MENLNRFGFNLYSQRGEDGILDYIFNHINIKRGLFCEFGAWDGVHLSNCAKLYDQGWSGIFIESDQKKYRDLLVNYFGTRYEKTARASSEIATYKVENRTICTLNRKVEPFGEGSIDELLGSIKIDSLDLLSIDVDGLDYLIFKNMKLRPKVVVVEGGKYVDPTVDQENSDSPEDPYPGQSLGCLQKVGKSKGYELVCFTQNAIFVAEEFAGNLSFPRDIVDLYMGGISRHTSGEDLQYIRHILTTYKIRNPFLESHLASKR